MSLSDAEKILRAVNEVREALEGASMEYGNALTVADGLKSIEALARRLESEYADETRKQGELIEGLLANWPHTEITKHYKPSAKPVLTKEEALGRASIFVKKWA